MTEPEPELPQLVVDAEGLASHAAGDDHHQRPEQRIDTGLLVSGLRAADPRRQEKAAAHPGRRDPEDGELQVPGARQVVGQPTGDVEPVKGSRLHPIVGEHASQERLRQEQESHDCEVPSRGPLAGRELRSKRSRVHNMGAAALSLPAQIVELADDEEDQSQPRQEGDEAQGAPDVGLGGRPVSRDGLVRPVVGV